MDLNSIVEKFAETFVAINTPTALTATEAWTTRRDLEVNESTLSTAAATTAATSTHTSGGDTLTQGKSCFFIILMTIERTESECIQRVCTRSLVSVPVNRETHSLTLTLTVTLSRVSVSRLCHRGRGHTALPFCLSHCVSTINRILYASFLSVKFTFISTERCGLVEALHYAASSSVVVSVFALCKTKDDHCEGKGGRGREREMIQTRDELESERDTKSLRRPFAKTSQLDIQRLPFLSHCEHCTRGKM